MRPPVFRSALFAFFALVLSAARSSSSPADSAHFCAFDHYEESPRDHPRPASKGLANLNAGEPRTVRTIYFLPNDRPLRQDVVDSMKVRIRQVQSFYGEQMQAHGHGARTFRIETDARGEPLVHRVNGEYPDRHYLDETSVVFREIGRMFDLEENIYIVVVDLSMDHLIGTGGGNRAHGTGGGYKKSGWILVPGSRVSLPGIGYGFGLVAHELGHAFGLLHDFRDGQFIMSYGPGWTRLSACTADFLAAHPYFNSVVSLESDKARLPAVELVSPASSASYPAGTGSVPIRLRAAASRGLHQVVLFALTRGLGGFEIRECRGMSGEREAVVEFDYDGTIPSSPASSLSDPVAHPLRLQVVDSEGDASWTDFVLAELSPRRIASLAGHTGAVTSVSFSPDGGTLASGSLDGKTILWDVESRGPGATLDGGVNSVSFSPGGAILASGSGRTVRLWNTRERIAFPLDGHTDAVNAVSFSPEGATLASGSRDGTVILWDVATRDRIGSPLDGHADAVNTVSFSPDGAALASGSRDGTIILWDTATRNRIGSPLEGHADAVNTVSFSPDGATLASGSRDGTIILWDTATRGPIATLAEHVSGVSSVSFASPGGGTLASGSRDGTVVLWDQLTEEKITAFGHTDEILSVSFASGGDLLAAGGRDGAVLLWDTSEWTGPRPFALEILSGDGQQGAPGAALAQPLVVEVRDQYGDPVAGARVTFTVRVGDGQLSDRFTVEHTTTDASGRTELILTLGPNPGLNTVGVSIRGIELATVTAEGVGAGVIGMEGDHRTWHLPGTAVTRLGKGLLLQGDRAVAHSADGRYLAVASYTGVWLYEAATYRPLALLPIDNVNSLAFSRDGTVAVGVVGGVGLRIELWNVETGERIGTLSHSGQGQVASLAFSPEGTILASGSTDQTIDLWDWETRSQIGSWKVRGHSDLFPLAFSPDGSRLASGSDGGTVRLWEVATQKEVATLPGHTGQVNSVLFSPDGALLASAGGFSTDTGWYDSTIRLWDTAALREVATLREHEHGEAVYSLDFSPDGARLASGSMDRTVRLWDVATRALVTTLEYASQVQTVSFSRDAATLVVGALGGLWLRDMETGNVAELPGYGGLAGKALSPDGALLAMTGQRVDYDVKLWDLRTQSVHGLLEGHRAVTSVAFSPDGASLAGGSFVGPAIKLWNVADGRVIGTFEGGQGGGMTAVAFSPDGALLAAGSRGGKINLWNVATLEWIAALPGHTTRIDALSFSPDGILLASGSYDGTARVWDVAAREQIAAWQEHSGTVHAVSFSPDGVLLATAGGVSVRIWDVAASEQIAVMEARGGNMSLSWSRDGTTLAAGMYDRIKLWDVATRRETSTLDLDRGLANQVMFSPDGMLIAGMHDRTTLMWDLRPGPRTVDKVSGDGQQGAAGAAVSDPLVVEVRDQNGDPVEGTEVAFEVAGGGGTLSAATATTDAEGRASTTLILGRTPGTNSIQATVAGLEPVTFTATGTAIARALDKVSGDGQQGPAGAELPEPFVITVADQNGDPFPGAAVAFAVTSGGGTLSAATATTDAEGRASTTLILGRTPGTNSIQAAVAGLEPVTFTATAEATPDFDGDGATGLSDFFLLAEAFGGSDPRFDLDGSGTVDFTDFFLFAESFGEPERAKLVAMARELIGLPDARSCNRTRRIPSTAAPSSPSSSCGRGRCAWRSSR